VFYRIHSSVCILFICFVLIPGCSDTPPTNTDPKPDVSPDTTFHNFLSYKVTMWDASAKKNRIVAIKALNIENLEETIDVDNSDDGSIRILASGFQHGNYNEANYTISGYHTTDLIYVNGNHLKRLPVYQASEPVSVQLSAESGGYYICLNDYRRANDYANPGNSRLVYKKMSGLDDIEQCHSQSGAWYMVSVNDDEGTLPKRLPTDLDYVVSAVHGTGDGSLFAWVVVSEARLKIYDADFTNAQVVSINAGPVVVEKYARLVTRTASKHMLIEADGRLIILNPYTNEVMNGDAGFELSGNQRIATYPVADGEKVFFVVETMSDDGASVSTSEIKSFDAIDGAVTTLVTEQGSLGKLAVSQTHLLYGSNPSESWPVGRELKKISKQGGVAQGVGTQQDIDGVANIYGSGEYFYINIFRDSKASLERLHQSQQTGILHAYHRIIGATYSDRLDPTKFYLDLRRLIVVQSEPDNGGKNLHVIDVQSGQMKILGALPNEAYLDSNFEYVEALGHDHALIGIYHQGIRDLYYIDASRENSLKRLGVHTPENENGIYYKISESPKTPNGHTDPRIRVPVY
jgi:hypothetical protein